MSIRRMRGKNMIKNIPFSSITINDGFWKQKQKMVRENTVYAVYDRFQDTGRFAALECKWKEGDPDTAPHIYWDSDVAKWIEGVAYLTALEKCEELEKIADEAIENIIKNSDEHGYFNSHYLVTEQDKRFTNRMCHELYCAGHLIEAAVAYYDATGKDAFLKAMCRFADYIEQVFKVENSAAFITPGHPELELALVKLYHATGEKRYLELSKYFIDEHGTNDKDITPEQKLQKDFPSYNQDEMPLRERVEVKGHCVRALYLLCGMADLALEYEDKELAAACERCFDNIVYKRMYITGGVGSTHAGETFTVDYHLPNRTAYAETCAAISLAMFAGRMQCLRTDGRFGDIVERVLYNGMLSGISMDGRSFFYENPLEIDPDFNDVTNPYWGKEHYPITQRKEVFDCSCCPPNLLRFISSVAGYLYSCDEDTVYIHQFMDSETDYQGMRITQKTKYPSEGEIQIHLYGDKKYVAIRIPGWCKDFSLDQPYELKDGYAYISLHGETQITLNLQMPVTMLAANRRVHDNAGRIAVMRGPVVYCLEGVDNGEDLRSIHIPEDAEFVLTDNEFMVPSLQTKGYRPAGSEQLYLPAKQCYEEISLRLIPYYAFANRGASEMLVWILQK